MKPLVLSLDPLPPFLTGPLAEHFDFHADLRRNDPAAFERLAPQARGLVGRGETVLTGEMMAHFPKAEIISIFGVGYDGIDVPAARARGIAVTHTPNVLTDDVADLALALLLAVSRRLLPADRHVRSGGWLQGPVPLARKLSGARLGIIGLGRIGSAIAKRAEAFGMSIAYTKRTVNPAVAYRYYPTALALAAEVDFLVVAAFGGPTTRGLVNADVLKALGPNGYLVNIARGSVVDEAALVAALREGRIAGAGLDVFANEPNVPAELFALDNVVLTPHIGSATTSTRHAMADLAFANLAAHFAGKALPSEVPR
jgi:lactate dehydrogenase-like 2-hydroxyacid dehydrogenase